MASQLHDVDSTSHTEIILPGTFKTRLREFGKFRLLVVLTFLLFVVCIVLTVLLATRPSSKSATGSNQQSFICDTEECVFYARDVINQINKSADPCDDFYEFACGGWIKRNPLTANESSVSGFTVLNDDNMEVLKSALENAATNYSQNAAVVKTAKFYNTCLNTTSVETKGAAPLQDLIREYGGWTLKGSANTFSPAKLMGKVMRELGVDSFLSLSVAVDLEDNSRHILKLGPARLGMSYDYYVKDSKDNMRIRTAYQTYMKKVAKLLGGGADSDSKMMNIYDFEKKLATIAEGKDPDLSLVETLEEHRRTKKSLLGLDKTVTDFCYDTDFPSDFILNFFNEAFKGIYQFDDSDEILALPDWYFQNLGQYYNGDIYWSGTDTLKDYIIWRVVDRYVTAMPSQFADAKMKFTEALMGPRTSQRWTDCINQMMTPLDMPLGLLFVDAHFDEDRKTTVIDMTKRIRTAFIDNLKNEQWMDQYTKDGAKQKALAIMEDIGYPSWIKDPKKLAAAYSALTVTDGNFFDSYRALSSFARVKNFKELNAAVNKDKWMVGPAQVNGYYSPQQNRIVFLAAIIQPPFYIPSRPRYMNYGGIGMVIGHEITHGFDGSGRLFDGDGNVRDWWSYSSTYNFAQRAKCLVKQYSKYEVFGKKVNGTQTLNENIADNGGIKLAYNAYQAWVKDNKPEGRLPGLGLSVDQLFFVGFARPWCSIYKRDAALLQLRVDSHTFNKYRVIGPLSNFDKFSEAYSCKKGTNMNPYSQCAVW